MSDVFKKVRAGQSLRIPAAAYNAFVDAAVDLKRRQADISRGSVRADRRDGVILVRNDSGQDRGRFELLGLEEPVHAPADNEDSFLAGPVMTGVSPSPERHFCRFGLLLEPIAAEAMGLAMVRGVTIGRLFVLDERHEFAGIDPRSPVPRSAPVGGARVLWKEDGLSADPADLKWCVLLLGHQAEPSVGVFEEGSNADHSHAAVLSFSDPVHLTPIAPGVVGVEMYA